MISEKKSPFKFLDAYGKGDKDIFFGREKEIELLYDTTFETNLMLVYGQSGTGKTSLIQCGLANRFPGSDWFALYTRRADNINTSLWREIYRFAKKPIKVEASVPEAVQSLYLDYFKPVYLIFDQFEELFILGGPEEQDEFFETAAELLRSGISCKLIFVMREEYIARLYDFEKVVPVLFDHRIRVEPMQPVNIEKVIRGSAGKFGISIIQPEETVKGIIENNKGGEGMVQLPYLQVYLDRLYREGAKVSTVKDGPVEFTPALVKETGKISDVMAAFLDEQTEQVQQTLIKKHPGAAVDAVRQVLNEFASVEGTNLPLQKEALYTKLALPKDVVDFCLTGLEKGRLLRLNDRENTYEAAHDTLARKIDDSRSIEEKALLKAEKLVKDRLAAFAVFEGAGALLTEKELNYIEAYVEKLKSKLGPDEIDFITESRKKITKRKRFIVFTVSAIIIILLLVTTIAVSLWRKAEESFKNIALTESNRLAALATEKVKKDPTNALRIAEKAYRLDKNEQVRKTIHKIYSENNFYKVVAKHGIFVTSATISPDGRYILTGSKDNTARLWDLHGKEIQVFRGHKELISSVAFSPNRKTILTGSFDKTARLWDLQGKQLEVFKGHKDDVTSVAFSPDGKTILTGSIDRTARLWNLHGKEIQVFRGHEELISSVAFSPDGKTILTSSFDNTARLWKWHGTQLNVFRGHEGDVESVVFSPDGKTILTGSADKTARLWDLHGNQLQVFMGHKNTVTSAAFSPDGKAILTGSYDRTVRLWNLQGQQLQVFIGHKMAVTSVAFSPDGKTILTGSIDSTARLWDLQKKEVTAFSKHEKSVTSVAFSPDGKTILTGSEDKTVRLRDLQGKEIQILRGHKSWVTSVAFSPDGKTILTGSIDRTARLWNLQGKQLQVFRGHKAAVYSVIFSPNGKYILTGSRDFSARLWNLQGKQLQVIMGHKAAVYSVTFSPNGKTILTGSRDRTARLWDLQGKQLQVLRGHQDVVHSVTFSPDGKTILTGSWDNTARLWDLLRNQKQVFRGNETAVYSVAFSPNGNYILTGSQDKTARLWNLQGMQLQVFRGHEDQVYTVAFSPDSKSILTGSVDGTARLWEIKMPLDEFLKKGNFEELSEAQKRQFGIKD
ncbi:MAG: WD40 repeat domain-containing protein [Candidatus Aminicenantes bacterium]|nr:WD40 repeat domain-containing protein [Candidatus Aminicenantes bacterium]